jgi:hypothetical protein
MFSNHTIHRLPAVRSKHLTGTGIIQPLILVYHRADVKFSAHFASDHESFGEKEKKHSLILVSGRGE